MASKCWHEGAYGFWHLRLPGGLTGIVGWDSTRPKDSNEASGYKVSFEHTSLVARFKSLDEAKAACEAMAKNMLQVALKGLEG